MSVFELIKSDLYRYHGRYSILLLIKSLVTVKGFKFSFWLRLAKHYDKAPVIRWLPKLLFMYYKRVQVSDINYRAEIGAGFSLYHVFGTTFSDKVILGANNTILHGVTLGSVNGLYPKSGNNVYFGPGCCVLGGITIGNNVVIAANAVVTKDIPDNAIVAGNPSNIVSYKGAEKTLKHPIPMN
ncbi:serine acetyltransferase [Cycloclasticus sp. 46_120_T64]|nr:serine acetyltransferase [Cycloclasticus sp. 46_120_T64]